MALLKKIGKIRPRSASEIAFSRLSVGFEALDRKMFDPSCCYAPLTELGVKNARLQTGWNRCETVRGQYDFSWLDECVDSLLAHGVQPWFNLGYGNKLYMPGAPDSAVGHIPHGYGPEAQQAWCNFISALVKHFAGRVNKIEIWNEPNIPCFWEPLKCSGKEYAKLIGYTAPVIRTANPDAIVGGCTAEVGCPFILEMLETGIGKELDFFSVHPYTPCPEHNYFNSVLSLKNIFRRFAPHVKLQQGECGYPSQAKNHHDEWMKLDVGSQTIQSRYIGRRLFLDAIMDFSLISYFHISDLMASQYVQANGQVRPPVMLGVLDGQTYKPKKSYFALQNLAAFFANDWQTADLWMNLEIKDYSTYRSGALPVAAPICGKFIKNGYPVYGYYCPEELQREMPEISGLRMSVMNETEKHLSDPVLFDPMDGSVYELGNVIYTNYEFQDRGDEVCATDLTGNAVIIRDLVMRDYPLFVTDKKALEIVTE
jgi:hypothetical protein